MGIAIETKLGSQTLIQVKGPALFMIICGALQAIGSIWQTQHEKIQCFHFQMSTTKTEGVFFFLLPYLCDVLNMFFVLKEKLVWAKNFVELFQIYCIDSESELFTPICLTNVMSYLNVGVSYQLLYIMVFWGKVGPSIWVSRGS